MRAVTSAVSIGIHAALGAAVLFGGANTARLDAPRYVDSLILVEPVQSDNRDHGEGLSVPGPITIDPPDLRSISIPSLPQTGATRQSLMSPAGSTANGMPNPGNVSVWIPWRNEASAEILTAPLPTYPELLRQAGIAGKVVLEAVVDTTGRVLAQSITVVSATDPGFVEAARQALLQTLFRPAMADGKPVRLRVRIPYDFTIRNGIGRAR